MNESFPNIRGQNAAIDAVKRWWISLFGARTIDYHGKRGFSHSAMDIAGVVQLQIPSTRAGVMFTIDPASDYHDQLVIEDAFGLGESVVSGQVSPDRYVVDKPRRAIVVRSMRPKELVIEPDADRGTRTRELTAEESHRPVLSDDEVLALAALGIRIERAYGSPQDTEWAFAPVGTILMLQSRPITTTAARRPARRPEPDEKTILLRGLGAAPGLASGTARYSGRWMRPTSSPRVTCS